MPRAWTAIGVALAFVLGLSGAPAAQPPTQDERAPAQPRPVPPGPTGPTVPVPPPVTEEEQPQPPTAEVPADLERVPEQLVDTYTPTFIGPDLFNPPPHRGWINITPSFTLSGEYNDNLFFSERDRQSDGIMGFTPGLTLSMQRADYRLLAGYNTSGQIFLEESDLNNFGEEQQFFTDFSYRLSPRVSFALSDRFLLGRSSNTLTSSGASVGRQNAWRNTLTPRLRWQAAPNTSVAVTASYTILRFPDDGGSESDTYRLGAGVDHRLTRRLTGRVGAGVAFLDFKDEPHAWTYSPSVGFAYDVTRTLRVSVGGGPSVVDREGDITVTPAVAASLTQAFKFGTVGLGYDKAVTAETIGISDRQAVFATVDVPTLLRGLRIGFSPRYSIVDTELADRGDERTLKVLNLNLRATYQIGRGFSVIGSYTFFHQNTDRTRGDTTEIDQNRVFLGVQYAFPINIY